MNANQATKSVFKGTLVWDTFVLPIQAYKSDEPFGISGSLFHEGCDGKINAPHLCEEHPDLDFPQTYSAIQTNTGTFRKLDKQTKAFLLELDGQTIQIVSSHRLQDLASLLISNRFVGYGYYELVPQLVNRKPNPAMESIWNALLTRLRIKKMFLVLKAPLGGMNRYCAFFSDGHLVPLLNDEEIREPRKQPSDEVPEKQMIRVIDLMLSALQSPFPVLSCKPIIDAVEEFRTVKVPKKGIAAKKVGVNKMLVDLEQAVKAKTK